MAKKCIWYPLAGLLALWGNCIPVFGMQDSNSAMGSNNVGTKFQVTNKKMIGYVANWAKTREGEFCGQYARTLGTVDATLFTHLIYSFLNVNKAFHVELTEHDTHLKEHVIAAKGKNPNVKVLFAVGGWSFNDDEPTKHIFSKMVSTPESRKVFIKSCLDMAQKYQFDGLDLDWEYPGLSDRGGKPSDKENLVKLFQEFRKVIAERNLSFLLSIASPIGYGLQYYDLPALAQQLDFINIMTYDFHGPWESKVNSNAPLEASPGSDSISSLLQQNYLSLQIPKEKLILGLPLYGVSWDLDRNIKYLQVPAFGTPGIPSPLSQCTEGKGTLGNFEIHHLFKGRNSETLLVADTHPRTGVSFLALPEAKWISFDTPQVLKEKVSYVHQESLGGVMLWSVDQDVQNYSYSKMIKKFLHS